MPDRRSLRSNQSAAGRRSGPCRRGRCSGRVPGSWGGREGGLNHSCRLELWFGTMSTTTLMPCSWAALASSSNRPGAELRVDVAVVVHVVAAVGELGRVERAQPDGVHAEFGEVVDLLGDACDAAQARTAGVLEGTRVHLVDHGLLPPQRRIGSINFLLHHMFSLSFASLQNDSGYISSNYR